MNMKILRKNLRKIYYHLLNTYAYLSQTFHLDNLTLKEVDLQLVNQIVPLGVLREGKADASLRIKHSRQQNSKTSLTGSISLSKGRITGWTEPINAKNNAVIIPWLNICKTAPLNPRKFNDETPNKTNPQ